MTQETKQPAGCPTGKRSYSHQRARRVLARFLVDRVIRGDWRRREQAIYQCKACGRWHLTSRASEVQS